MRADHRVRKCHRLVRYLARDIDNTSVMLGRHEAYQFCALNRSFGVIASFLI